MTVLELSAVNLNDRPWIAKKRFGDGFHHARLARAGRPKKEKVSHGTPWGVQSREKHLINFYYFFDGRVLADDFPPQSGFEVLRVRAAPGRIKCGIKAGPHKFPASFCRGLLPGSEGKMGDGKEASQVVILI